MSESIDEEMEDVYRKYLEPVVSTPEQDTEAEIMARESEATCPKCGSENVDHSRGYRGEYTCRDCRHMWQVGGKDARS